MRRGNIALLAGVLLVCGAQANILIDDFTDGFANASTTSSAYYNTGSSTAIGGFRYVDHQFAANPLVRPIATEVNNSVPGNFFLEAGSGVSGQVTLVWGGDTTSASGTGILTPSDFDGLGSVDFTSELGVEVDYINNDQASTQLAMVVWDSMGSVSSSAFAATTVGNGSVFFDFASFGGSADLTDVDIIALAIRVPNGNDITLTRVEAVPEPATMTILGLGIAGIAARRRRKA